MIKMYLHLKNFWNSKSNPGKGLFGRVVLVFCFYLAISATLSAQTPVSVNGKLKVTGTQLVNKNGTAIQLRGMSTHGVQWYTEDYNYNSLSVLVNNWGIDVFRIAMYPTDQPDQTGNAYEGNPTFWRNYTDNLVDQCGKLGVYCMIDWHVLTPGDPSNSNYYQMAKDFWDYMSKKHAGKDHVIYEICNEPNGVSWSTVKSYAETIIPIIRKNDPTSIIIVGSPTWSSDVDIAANDPITGVTNLMYSFHFYAASHGQSYRDKITTAISKGLAIFATEWGSCDASGTGTNNMTETNLWINFMQTNKISWCNWSYSDKNETAATLTPGAGSAQQWNNTNAQGNTIKGFISTPADSWISSGNWTPSSNVALPLNGSYFLPNTAIAIKADAADKDGTIASVDFLVDGVKVGTSTTAPYSYTWTPTTAKDYVITTQSKDNAGAIAVSLPVTYRVVTTLPAQTPYGGTAFALPTAINTASSPLNTVNFDNGGELIAYHDLDGVHKGPKTGNLRQTEGVDVEGSNNIGYVLTGEWVEYTVNNTTSDGTFDITLNYTTPLTGGGAFHFECNGASTSVVLAPATGGWSSYQPLTATGLLIPAGLQVVRLYIDRGNINLSTMTFTRKTSGTTYTITATAGAGGSISPNGAVEVAKNANATFAITANTGYSITSLKVDNVTVNPIVNPYTFSNVTANHTIAATFTGSTPPNIALGKTVRVSSVESASYPGSNAVDGNTATRWSSTYADNQWIEVDLSKEYTVEGVTLNWETASSKDYRIEVSNDATTWTSIATKTGMSAGPRIDAISGLSTKGRYVRMYATARNTQWGNSLFEFEIYGKEGTGNNSPIANAGQDQNIIDTDKNGSEEVTLNGAASTDADGTIVKYEWKKGSTVIATGVNPKVTLAVGSHVISLTVTDNAGAINSNVASTTVTINTPGTPGAYAFGKLPSLANPTDAQNMYQTIKTKFVEFCPDGKARIKWGQAKNGWEKPGETVSEGIGYGMILAAYFDDKTLFDALWQYYKAFPDANGLMNWHTSGCSSTIEFNGATDSELDCAFALVIAAKRWSTSAKYNYTTEANWLIGKIKQFEVEANTYVLKAGDVWGGSDVTNISYYSPAYYKVFGQFTNDVTFWTNVTDKCYQVINNNLTANNAVGGLVSDWCKADGTSSGKATYYYYDACRTPWRIALDYAWFGDARAKSYLDKVNSFVTGLGGITKVVDGYNQNGTVLTSQGTRYHNTTACATFACAAVALTDDATLNAYYKEMDKPDTVSYFDHFFLAFGKTFLTGKFYNPMAGEQNPVANAGADQSKMDADNNGSESVTLDGSASSSPNGAITSYIWKEGATQIANVAKPTVTLSVGVHTITLTVVDSKLKTSSDDVKITITAQGNQAPVANAGADQTVTDVDKNGSEVVVLDGSNSTDADGTIASYVWKNGTTQIATGVKPSVTLPVGTNTITLTVTDNLGAKTSDDVVITVKSGSCSLLTQFAVPRASALPGFDNKAFAYAYVLGTGGPSMASVTNFTINWSSQYNGLWQFSFNLNVSPWWLDLLPKITQNFGSASPACKITGSGIAGLDGDYWVNADGTNFVMVAKSGAFAIYFSTSATPPAACGTSMSAKIATNVSKNSINNVSFYPTLLRKGDELKVKLSENAGNAKVAIIDANGRIVYNQLLNSSTTVSINENFNAGMYFITIVENNNVTKGKLIVQ